MTYKTILFATLMVALALSFSAMNEAKASHGYVDSWRFESAEIVGTQFNFPMVQFAMDYKGSETSCSLSVEKLIEPGDPMYGEHYAGKYVRISFTQPYDCNTDPVLPLYIVPNETLTLKIILRDGGEYTVIYVENYTIEPTPQTPWTLNGAEITKYDPGNRTYVTYDLDYTGNYENCIITLYKFFPHKYDGHYKNISDGHYFKCNEDATITSNVHPGETNHYILALQEGFRVTYTEIKLKNFTFELE